MNKSFVSAIGDISIAPCFSQLGKGTDKKFLPGAPDLLKLTLAPEPPRLKNIIMFYSSRCEKFGSNTTF